MEKLGIRQAGCHVATCFNDIHYMNLKNDKLGDNEPMNTVFIA